MSTELIIPTTELKEMAKYMGPLFQKRPEDLFALMLIAQAEHKHPAIAAQEYDIINGRPALKASAVQARFQAAGGKIQYIERTEEKVTIKFSHPEGGTLQVTWTIETARNAGLLANPTWKKYPRQMLTARAIAEGVRAIFPGCLTGFYVPEEVQDFEPQEPRNVTPEPVPERKAEPAPVQKPKALQGNASAPVDAEVSKPQEAVEPQKEPEAVKAPAKTIEDEDLVNRMLAAKASNIPEVLALIEKNKGSWKNADREQRERMVVAIEEQWEILKVVKAPEPVEAAPAPQEPDLVAQAFDGEVVDAEDAGQLGIF